MQKILSRFIKIISDSDFLWSLFKSIAIFGQMLFDSRNEFNERKKDQIIGKRLFNNLDVQNGPFKGMKYIDSDKSTHTYLPKLLGSYEKELWPVIEKITKNNYDKVYNIGCGEGYYAVGLGFVFQNTPIFAYDIEEDSRKLCRNLAEINGIIDRVQISAHISHKELGIIDLSNSLIICDCEGFEKHLFTNQNISNLEKCDLVIETHDFMDIDISTYLKKLFQETHQIESILSIDDIQKAIEYDFKELESFSLTEKALILQEKRPAQMEWLFCTSKHQ